MRNDLLTIALLTAMLPSADAFSRSRIPEGMSEVILEARDVFGNGHNGFQLLLDADHSTYGNIFFNPGSYFFGDYSEFEYKIPENADPVGDTPNCVVDGEVSVYVPAGTYDWMSVVPLYEGMGIPAGDYAVGDDFVFEAGKTYRFKAGMRPTQYGEEDFIALEVECDYGISSLQLPSTGMGMTRAEDIAVKVTNCATSVSENVKVWYSINGGDPVRETLPGTIAPGESLDYVFMTKADFSSPAIYNVTAGIEAPGDMLPLNNTVSGTFRHLQPLDLPFAYDFASNMEAFDMDWIVIDANGDDSTWRINEWIANPSGAQGVASCSGNFNGDKIGDDWLISQPLNMSAGTGHVLLDIRSVLEDTMEKLEVCIGGSPRPEDMRVLATFEFATEEWIKKAVNFDVPSEGIYYVALHGVSEAGLNIHVADILVDNGEFVGKPEITVTRILAPFTNCDLPSDGKVGLLIENHGTADLKDFTITCNVNGPGNAKAVVSETFDTALSPDGKSAFMIGEGVDFSKTGFYDLDFRLTAQDVEVSAMWIIECLEPYADLPVQTNFSNNENTSFWTMMDEEGWHYEAMFNDFSAQKHGVESGLLGRGMTLSNPVRVKMSYVAAGGWENTALTVLFGKAGDDPSTYETAFVDDNVTNEAKETEFTVPVTEPGNYSVVIADTGDSDARAHIRLNEVVISELFPHDLRVEGGDGPVSRYIPASHTGKKGVYGAMVTNRGSEQMTGVRIDAKVNGMSAGSSAAEVSIPAGESVTIPFEAELPVFAEGDTFTFDITVSANEPDAYMADNTWTFPEITVTRDMLSTENLTDLVDGTGAYGAPLYVGNVYNIAAPSALTSVDLGLCHTDMSETADSRIGLNIYIVEDGKLGRRIFSHECARGNGGFLKIDMQDMLLPSGSYYFEAAQLSTVNFGLAYDSSSPESCWMREGDELSKVQGYPLAIRAFFAADAKVYAKDAAVAGFAAPDEESALFGDGETVIVNVRNSGSEDAEFDVELSVDGVSAGIRQVSSLFFEDIPVEFTGVDLSEPGTHTLECVVRLSGDENASNDKMTKTIESAEPRDPYFMDFESCHDFDAAGDRLNPAWTTEDLNGINTDLFWRYNHPNRGVPCGFMAYNTHTTVPSMDETPINGFYAYEGDRFGVAFCYNQYAEGAEGLEHSDVWIVSPYLQLGDDTSFKAYVKTFALETLQSELEPFSILVSEEADGYDSFTVVGEEIRRAPVEEWGLAEADLSAYDNKKVRVALRYTGVPMNNTCLMIDNLKIDTQRSAVADIEDGNSDLRYDSARRLIIFGNGDRAVDLEVYTVDGTRVAFASKASTLDVSMLPAGVYVARAGSSVLKFMK